MTGKHHLIAGTVAGCCVLASTIIEGEANYLVSGATVLTTMVGSLFPDIDSKTSKLGSKLKITSTIANKLFGHRGFLHSPLFVMVMALICGLIFNKASLQQFSLLYYGFIIGMVNHLFCDLLTKGGIPLFYPASRWKFSISPMKSGSKWEFIPLTITCTICVVLTILMVSSGTFL